jgi:hypothetical protein
MYKSLMKDDDLVRGTSSDINMFSTDMTEDLSVGWEATYTIAETLEEANPIIRRALPLNDGTDGTPANSAFVHQILPHESQMLEPGKKYWVTIEIKNDSIQYNAEVAQYKLKILPQGVL